MPLTPMTGGTLGNVIDRLRAAQVTDFVHLYFRQWNYPVSNLADSAITIGAVLLLLFGVFAGKHRTPCDNRRALRWREVPMNQSELLDAALKLDVRMRADLADQLLQSLDQLSPTELEALWVDEALLRDNAMQRGQLGSVPASELISDLRAACD